MLFVTVVLDGVGVGAQVDAPAYGDAGSHTLGHVCEHEAPSLPNLQRMGLGCVTPLPGVPCPDVPAAHFGRMREVSAGKDSTTGHWELAGLRLPEPFPTYPDGFPDAVIDAFVEATGCDGVLGNKAESGTTIIAKLGEAHAETGNPIVYTSADSVFQIAAHKDVIPLERLYALCEAARHEVCVGEHAVGRVIARPYVGTPGNYTRISSERRDYTRLPHRPPVQQVLQDNGVRTIAIGKIGDLFGDVGFDAIRKTKGNDEGIQKTLQAIQAYTENPEPTFVWTNLVDFDQAYGHRNDPKGFSEALEAFDQALPALREALPDDAALVLTADHGNDPTTASTDHAREYVPVLYDPPGRTTVGQPMGLRASFNDHAATVADCFDVPFETRGVPVLRTVAEASGE